MVDKEEALRHAGEFLKAHSANWPTSQVRLDTRSSFIDANQLVVMYNSTAYLDEGQEGAALGGNLPIRVDLATGECEFITMDDVFDYMDRGLIS